MKSTQLAGYIVLMLLNNRDIYKKALVFAQNRFTDVASISNALTTLVLVRTSMHVPCVASPISRGSGLDRSRSHTFATIFYDVVCNTVRHVICYRGDESS